MATTGPAYNYTVKMTCGGCSGAIDRVLKKNIEAPNGYTVSLETQKTITEKIAKTGKEIISKEEIAAGAPIPA
ncbi:Cytosolic copper metallochaperone [Vanrija albida]|uniref:Cytosolic copper metallochaperone n=1 Tax=Vanrija albida TaxID=181172 RepID=A0ABR3Q0U5_9TREE